MIEQMLHSLFQIIKYLDFSDLVIQRIHTQRPLSIWIILKKINGTNWKIIEFLKDNINFEKESVSTMYYGQNQNQNQILIYCGIQGDEEDFVTKYYLLYDSKNNTMDKIDK